MKPWDLVICDVTNPIPGGYELQTLSTQGVGGTEATVVRVAEGLASLGARVAVVQHNLEMPIMGAHAYYLPLSMLDEIKTANYVALRGIQFLDKFPKAKKYSWHEDLADARMATWVPKLIDSKTTVIGASKWHKNDLSYFMCDKDRLSNPKITYIHNPVPDEIMIPKGIDVKYNPNKMVWLSSPHKGLKRAVELFNRVVEVSGNKDLRLHTFNPGYAQTEEYESAYVINHGPVPCQTMWQHVSESLCVFYPTSFKETFGCIAAEANALHTPVLTNEVGALAETVSSRAQFVERGNDKAFIDTAISWNKGYRPKVWGQERFATSQVLKRWYKLLEGKELEDV